MAGRDEARLAKLREELAAIHPECSDVALIRAEAHDHESLRAMAKAARVVVTTVGPYRQLGEPVLVACLESGTDCCDLTGEPQWWGEMIARYHDRAVEAGVLVVSACGFDSTPHDLGTLFTANLLPEGSAKTIVCYQSVNFTPSGGTWATILDAATEGRRRAKKAETAKARSSGRTQEGQSGAPFHYAGDVKAWVAPVPSIDPRIVRRSAVLREGPYGPDFSYAHYFQAPSLLHLLGLGTVVRTLLTFAQIPAGRRFLANRRPAGTGPSEAQMDTFWFRDTFVGQAGGVRVVTQVSGGEPAYRETSKMVVEAALLLATQREHLPGKGGLSTPAAAIGEPLIERLHERGIAFEVLERPATPS